MDELLQKIGINSLSSLLSAILIFLVCWIVIKIVMKAVDRLLAKSKKIDGALTNLVRNAVNIALWVIAIIIFSIDR